MSFEGCYVYQCPKKHLTELWVYDEGVNLCDDYHCDCGEIAKFIGVVDSTNKKRIASFYKKEIKAPRCERQYDLNEDCLIEKTWLGKYEIIYGKDDEDEPELFDYDTGKKII